jgi:hypothetical protein
VGTRLGLSRQEDERMRIEWDKPVVVDLIEDSTDADAVSVRQGANGVVLLIVGKRRAVTLAVAGSADPVLANPEAQRVRDVIGVTIEPPADSLGEEAPRGHALVRPPAPEREAVEIVAEESVESDAGATDADDTDADATDSDDTGPATINDDRDDTIAGGSAFDDTILKPSATEISDSAFDDTVISASDTAASASDAQPEPIAVVPGSVPSVPASGVLPAVPGLPPLPADVPPARPNYRIRTAQGQLVVLDRPVYIGRAPRGSGLVAGAQPWLVPVPSPTREVSSTHLQIVQEGGTVVVHDLSSNGTIVIPPGQSANLLSVGQSRVVAVGTLLDIGDGNVIEVVAP